MREVDDENLVPEVAAQPCRQAGAVPKLKERVDAVVTDVCRRLRTERGQEEEKDDGQRAADWAA